MAETYQLRIYRKEEAVLQDHGICLNGGRATRAVHRFADMRGLDGAWVNGVLTDLRQALSNIHDDIANEAEAIFDSLERMNSILVRLGRPVCSTKTAAREAFRDLYLNIFDVVDGVLYNFSSLKALRKDCKRVGRTFPLARAKEMGARYLLKVMFH